MPIQGEVPNQFALDRDCVTMGLAMPNQPHFDLVDYPESTDVSSSHNFVNQYPVIGTFYPQGQPQRPSLDGAPMPYGVSTLHTRHPEPISGWIPSSIIDQYAAGRQ